MEPSLQTICFLGIFRFTLDRRVSRKESDVSGAYQLQLHSAETGRKFQRVIQTEHQWSRAVQGSLGGPTVEMVKSWKPSE